MSDLSLEELEEKMFFKNYKIEKAFENLNYAYSETAFAFVGEDNQLALEGFFRVIGKGLKATIDAILNFFKSIGRWIKGLFIKDKIKDGEKKINDIMKDASSSSDFSAKAAAIIVKHKQRFIKFAKQSAVMNVILSKMNKGAASSLPLRNYIRLSKEIGSNIEKKVSDNSSAATQWKQKQISELSQVTQDLGNFKKSIFQAAKSAAIATNNQINDLATYFTISTAVLKEMWDAEKILKNESVHFVTISATMNSVRKSIDRTDKSKDRLCVKIMNGIVRMTKWYSDFIGLILKSTTHMIASITSTTMILSAEVEKIERH